MKVNTTIVSTKEVDVPIPFFSRSKDSERYVAVLDENTFIKIVKMNGYTCIQNTSVEISRNDISTAYSEFISCTEAEFMEAYDKTIESISLIPKLAV